MAVGDLAEMMDCSASSREHTAEARGARLALGALDAHGEAAPDALTVQPVGAKAMKMDLVFCAIPSVKKVSIIFSVVFAALLAHKVQKIGE